MKRNLKWMKMSLGVLFGLGTVLSGCGQDPDSLLGQEFPRSVELPQESDRTQQELASLWQKLSLEETLADQLGALALHLWRDSQGQDLEARVKRWKQVEYLIQCDLESRRCASQR